MSNERELILLPLETIHNFVSVLPISKNSPFIGKEMNGKIVFTIAKGHLSKIE